MVKSGDSLWSIANKYNMTVDELKRINNLTSNNLSIGQILKLSSEEQKTSDGNTYTVKSGDSLWSIANKYNTSVDEIKKLNNLTSNNLSIGQVLKLPSQNTSNTDIVTYTVKSGDSLWNIAGRYNTTVDEIKSLNNLTNNNLSIGQVLTLPSSGTNTYTVKSGDSLWNIANRFGTTVNELKSINNLSTNNLSIGQVLNLP